MRQASVSLSELENLLTSRSIPFLMAEACKRAGIACHTEGIFAPTFVADEPVEIREDVATSRYIIEAKND